MGVRVVAGRGEGGRGERGGGGGWDIGGLGRGQAGTILIN